MINNWAYGMYWCEAFFYIEFVGDTWPQKKIPVCTWAWWDSIHSHLHVYGSRRKHVCVASSSGVSTVGWVPFLIVRFWHLALLASWLSKMYTSAAVHAFSLWGIFKASSLAVYIHMLSLHSLHLHQSWCMGIFKLVTWLAAALVIRNSYIHE